MQTLYEPANECIYCRKADERLSKEHIIPYSLGGKTSIPSSSCKDHRDITSALEKQVARDFYGRYRIAEGIKSRHKSARQQQLKQKIEIAGTTYDGEEKTIFVPIKNLPKANISVHLPEPQILSGEPVTEGPVGAQLKARNDSSARLSRFCRENGLKSISFYTAPIQCEIFLRVIAKIAHCFAVAEIGIDGFKPTLLPIIEGKSNQLIKYIGSESLEQPQSKQPLRVEFIEKAELSFVVVYVSLHFFPLLPEYKVVAGHF